MSNERDILEGSDVTVVSSGLPPQRPLPVATTNELRPLRWRELLAILLLIVLCDITMYRGQGPAGYALLFLAAPVLLLLGSPRPHAGPRLWIVSAMLVAISAKTVWCGSGLQLAAGFALLVAFAMALAGLCPYVLGDGSFCLANGSGWVRRADSLLAGAQPAGAARDARFLAEHHAAAGDAFPLQH